MKLGALAAWAVASASARASAECRIDEPKAELASVSVAASGVRFSLGLDAVPVQVRPDAGGPSARVDVLAPLRFTASHAGTLRYRVARTLELYGGRIRLGAGAMPKWLGVRGDALEASLVEVLHVRVQEPLRVPCSHLGLDAGKVAYATPKPLQPAAERAVGTGAADVPLYVAPVAQSPIHVSFPGAYEVESRRPGWVLLRASWADGTQLRGWTPEQWVAAKPEALLGSVEGLSHGGGCGRSDPPRLATFTLRRGAPIAAEPNAAPWAWSAQQLKVQAFPLEREDGWIQIAAITGLTSDPCTEHAHLWVHVNSLLWK